MTHLCQGPLCGGPAEVVIESSHRAWLLVCWEHLRQELAEPDSHAEGFHRIGWQSNSADADGARDEQCRTGDDESSAFGGRDSLDDPAWANLPGMLLSDEPGWSGG